MLTLCRRKWSFVAIAGLLLLVTFSSPRSLGQVFDATAPANPPAIPFSGSGVGIARPDFHEDWNNLTLSTSNLTAIEPLLGETDDVKENNFIREIYQVGWRSGDGIDLYVIRPRNVKNPPVVLYLYGFPQDTDRFKNKRWCELATDGGYAAVGFVSALTGQRFHDRPMKEWFVSEMQESLVTSVHDVQMILNFLETRKDLDMSRVGMYGSGSGGTIAILAAAVEPRIKVLDVFSPWADWPEWMATTNKLRADEHEKFTRAEFLAKIAPFDPVDWISKVKTPRVRIQNVRPNLEVSEKAQLKLETAAPDTTVLYQYGDSQALIRIATGGGIFEWMKKQLKADQDEKVVADRQKNTHFFPALGQKLPDPTEPFQRVN